MQIRLPNLHALLQDDDFKSPPTIAYNCVGYAVGDPRWWQPSGDEGHVWLNDLPVGDYSVAQYVDMFKRFGFLPCAGMEPEVGFEKLAVFGNQGEFEHVAIQLSDGRWISKLGDLEDIQHPAAQNLEGNFYGKIDIILKRPGDINRTDSFPLA